MYLKNYMGVIFPLLVGVGFLPCFEKKNFLELARENDFHFGKVISLGFKGPISLEAVLGSVQWGANCSYKQTQYPEIPSHGGPGSGRLAAIPQSIVCVVHMAPHNVVFNCSVPLVPTIFVYGCLWVEGNGY